MERFPSIEESILEGGETMHNSNDADEAPLPAPFEDISCEAERRPTLLVKSKARSRSPYTDRFGLRQPPPPSKLYGGDNLHYLTSRREYLKEDQDLLPFHHEPETYIPSTRGTVSTACYDTFHEAEAMQEILMEQGYKYNVDNRPQLQGLEDVKTFARRSTLLMKNGPSDRRSVEDRMEDLLKEYSFDKMREPTRKIDSAQRAEPYVPFPDKNVDSQRSATTLPRKESEETAP
ncbi:hypothetical protein XPA_001888 [Xanthoria parietina]